MVFLAFLAIVTNYMDRANLAVALPYMNTELHLSSAESGLILGAFFWTYAACQIPAGMLVDKFGAKLVFAGGDAAAIQSELRMHAGHLSAGSCAMAM